MAYYYFFDGYPLQQIKTTIDSRLLAIVRLSSSWKTEISEDQNCILCTSFYTITIYNFINGEEKY